MVEIMKRRTIFLNAAYLLTSNVLVKLISAFATILVARYLGAHDYGLLGLALAFAGVTGYFTDMGLTHTLFREATKPEANIQELTSSFFRSRLILAAIITLLSIVLIRQLYENGHSRYVLYWVVLPTIWGAAFQGVGVVYFQVIQKMQYTALIQGISGIITVGALFLGIIFHWPLDYLAPIYGFSSLIGGFMSFLIVISRLGWLIGWNPLILKGLASFTIGGFIVTLLPQIGPLLLERVTDLKQVGYFVAAYRIPSMLYQVPGTIAAAFYPVLFEYGNRQLKDEHEKLIVLELKVMSALGVMMALPFFMYPEWWVYLFFGSEWLKAVPVLHLLSVIVIMQSMNYPLADALTTWGWQKYRTCVLILALITGGCMYLAAGVRWGAFGGAIAAIAVEVVLLMGFATFAPSGWRLLFTGTWRNLVVLFLVAGFTLIIKRYYQNPLFNMILFELFYVIVLVIIDRSPRSFVMWQLRLIRSKKGVKRPI
jgi:O-antigen/teichoic acid export membrane protein